jgi:hypothetical protein
MRALSGPSPDAISGDIWLPVTDPDGVKAFLGEALSSSAQRLPGA